MPVPRWTAVAGAAVVLVSGAGCTAGRPAAAPGGTPTPPGLPSSPAGASPAPPQATLDSELGLPDSGDAMVWRESSHRGGRAAPYVNVDESAEPGAYALTVACAGGALTVTTPGRRTTVRCAELWPRIPICLKRTGLTVTAAWARPPRIDFAWQLDRVAGRCR